MSYGEVLSQIQLKNADSILEYEKMAEIGFEKRDFRMVSSCRSQFLYDTFSRVLDMTVSLWLWLL